ncbi:replicative DNA helicase [Bellilinea sp.]
MSEDFPPVEDSQLSMDQAHPHNREAEEAVLGSILINPEVYYEVAQILKPEDFYIVRNRWIWEAITRLHDRREKIDYLTLTHELEESGHLVDIGGQAYLMALLGQTPTSLHAEAYARIVEEASIRRKMLAAANEMAKLALDSRKSLDTLIGEAEKAVFGLSERRIQRDLQPIDVVLGEYYERIDQLAQRSDEIFGVPTGLVDLDKLLGGLQRSDFLIVAGRPGMGKTGFLLSVAKNAAQKHRKRVAIFSLEMSAEQLVQRLIAQETGIDTQRLRSGKLRDEEWALFAHAIEVLGETEIWLDDTPAITPLQLRTKCRRLHMEKQLDLVIVDYLQLMSGDIRTDNRVQEVSNISRNLKVLARELNVPVLAAAQLSRAVEQRADKKPVLSDLRESGCLTGNTRIILAESGREVPIRDLVGKTGFCVWALNENTLNLEAMPVSKAFETGTKKVWRLTTGLGRYIEATANHRFLTLDGWKRLDELSVGERIALPRVIPSSARTSIREEELALLGLLLGDGCILSHHAYQYTTSEADLAQEAMRLAQIVFPDQIEPRVQVQNSWLQVYFTSKRHHTHGIHSPMTDWLKSLGILNLRSSQKFVPEIVFSQTERSIATFLRYLWATDGSIQLIHGKKTRAIAYYTSSSEQLSRDVQSLLLRLGINALLRRVPQNGKGLDQWNVVITGKPDLNLFAEKVGAVGTYRERRLQEVYDYLQNRVSNTNRDVIPARVWRQVVDPAMQSEGITGRQLQAALGNAYCGTTLYKQNISRMRANRLAKILHSERLNALANSEVYWDAVVSIEYKGEEPVYDLTVPEHHNFVANNIIVHNSLEQDADIVMFIHRPEAMEKDSPRQNIAEIIVAKHRNGPTHPGIELVFLSNLARFDNAVILPRDSSERAGR